MLVADSADPAGTGDRHRSRTTSQGEQAGKSCVEWPINRWHATATMVACKPCFPGLVWLHNFSLGCAATVAGLNERN